MEVASLLALSVQEHSDLLLFRTPQDAPQRSIVDVYGSVHTYIYLFVGLNKSRKALLSQLAPRLARKPLLLILVLISHTQI